MVSIRGKFAETFLGRVPMICGAPVMLLGSLGLAGWFAGAGELEAFSYSVFHDLRAPLRVIDGWTLVFMEDYAQGLDDQGRTYLERVRTETQHMGQLIDDMLSLSRVGRAELQREPVDLTALAWAIIGRLRETGPERRVEFVIQEGLTAAEITPEAKILAVADVVEAMASHRPYRPALGIEKALGEIT